MNEKVTLINGLRYRTRVDVYVINPETRQILAFLNPTDSVKLPGGAVDQGETIIAAAKRELMEESGYIAHRFKHLVQFDDHVKLDQKGDYVDWFYRDGWHGEYWKAVLCEYPQFQPDTRYGSENDTHPFEMVDFDAFHQATQQSRETMKRSIFQTRFRLKLCNHLKNEFATTPSLSLNW